MPAVVTELSPHCWSGEARGWMSLGRSEFWAWGLGGKGAHKTGEVTLASDSCTLNWPPGGGGLQGWAWWLIFGSKKSKARVRITL